MDKNGWSQIGKRNRRVGKEFERVIARKLREVSGLDWQSTRNSGRTDLKGDVYCVNNRIYGERILIECKNRDDMGVINLLKGNKIITNTVIKGVEDLSGDYYKEFLLFVNSDGGVFYLHLRQNDRGGVDVINPLHTPHISSYLVVNNKQVLIMWTHVYSIKILRDLWCKLTV